MGVGVLWDLVWIIGSGFVVGWLVVDCHKVTKKRCDEDVVGLTCL